jgi:tRNA-specific adenosine deaminase 1
LVHDSHAEVVTKRAFHLYLIHQLEECLRKDNDSIFYLNENGKFGLKSQIKFHFYTSHPPCGDATIAPKRHSDDCDASEECDVSESKRRKLSENDIHRTGAKSIDGLDPHGEGAAYHVTGAIRTKPGKESFNWIWHVKNRLSR